VALGAVVVVLSAWPVFAAMELAYYRATSSPTSVLLEWATLREFNVEGFEILCKREIELDSSFHTIGSRIAQGGPEQGAQYSFNVTTGLFPGETYCFRLQERTTDGTPGEQFDLCGYGLGIAPTPMLTTTILTTTGELPTAIVVTPPPGITFTPTLPPTPVSLSPLTQQIPLVTATATFTPQVVAPTPTATFTVFPATPTFTVTPTATQPQSPIDVEAQLTAAAAAFANTPPVDPLIPPPTVPVTNAVNITQTPAPSPAAITPTLEATPAVTATLAQDPAQDALAQAPTPTPMYFVVTATPTAQAVAAAPTFTPWPTVTPTAQFGLMSLLAPTTQNMMVMLLCLIFFTASGLGTLGLVTIVIWLRSQGQRDRVMERLYRRRL
jgi:hypothetical protein